MCLNRSSFGRLKDIIAQRSNNPLLRIRKSTLHLSFQDWVNISSHSSNWLVPDQIWLPLMWLRERLD